MAPSTGSILPLTASAPSALPSVAKTQPDAPKTFADALAEASPEPATTDAAAPVATTPVSEESSAAPVVKPEPERDTGIDTDDEDQDTTAGPVPAAPHAAEIAPAAIAIPSIVIPPAVLAAVAAPA